MQEVCRRIWGLVGKAAGPAAFRVGAVPRAQSLLRSHHGGPKAHSSLWQKWAHPGRGGWTELNGS